MELLILKSRDDYIRIKDEKYVNCKLERASVFPLDKLAEVRAHKNKLDKLGFSKPSIHKLILKEELFHEN